MLYQTPLYGMCNCLFNHILTNKLTFIIPTSRRRATNSGHSTHIIADCTMSGGKFNENVKLKSSAVIKLLFSDNTPPRYQLRFFAYHVAKSSRRLQRLKTYGHNTDVHTVTCIETMPNAHTVA